MSRNAVESNVLCSVQRYHFTAADVNVMFFACCLSPRPMRRYCGPLGGLMACVLGTATSEFPLCMATDRWIFPANFAFLCALYCAHRYRCTTDWRKFHTVLQLAHIFLLPVRYTTNRNTFFSVSGNTALHRISL